MKQQKIDILKDIFPDFFIRKGEEFVCYCPKHSHHKKKLEINLETDRFACWVCKWSGNIFKLLKDCANKEQIKKYSSLLGFSTINSSNEEVVKIPSEYIPLFEAPDVPQVATALEYLFSSGIDEDIIYLMKLGICLSGDYKERIIFPSFDESGNLNYFQSRAIYDDNKPKYRHGGRPSRIVFNELYVDWSEPIVLIESVKTYCRHFKENPNLVCINGSKISKNFSVFEKIIINNTPEIIIGFDPDAEEETAEAINKFAKYDIPVTFINFSKQPDELDSLEFSKELSEKSSLDKFDILLRKIKNI